MKLFAFLRRARRPSSLAAPVEAAATAEQAPVALEDAAAPVEKRRRRPSSSGSAPAWKPTLLAISEDATVTAAAAAKAKAKAKPPPAKAKARPSPHRAARVDYDDLRHFGAPTVMPAFTPTAFLF